MAKKHETVPMLRTLRAAIGYNPETGHFWWKAPAPKGMRAGQRAGSAVGNGYRAIKFKRVRHYEHRLAYAFTHDKWPTHEVDHRNGDKADNRASNLRAATRSQNGVACDSNASRRNPELGRGVKRHGSRFQAQARLNGEYIYLGTFDAVQEARDAYRKFVEEAHGEFAPALPGEGE